MLTSFPHTNVDLSHCWLLCILPLDLPMQNFPNGGLWGNWRRFVSWWKAIINKIIKLWKYIYFMYIFIYLHVMWLLTDFRKLWSCNCVFTLLKFIFSGLNILVNGLGWQKKFGNPCYGVMIVVQDLCFPWVENFQLVQSKKLVSMKERWIKWK